MRSAKGISSTSKGSTTGKTSVFCSFYKAQSNIVGLFLSATRITEIIEQIFANRNDVVKLLKHYQINEKLIQTGFVKSFGCPADLC